LQAVIKTDVHGELIPVWGQGVGARNCARTTLGQLVQACINH
jgi:hypothetical protein